MRGSKFLLVLFLYTPLSYATLLQDFERISQIIYRKIKQEEKIRDEKCHKRFPSSLFKITDEESCQRAEETVERLKKVEGTVFQSIRALRLIQKLALYGQLPTRDDEDSKILRNLVREFYEMKRDPRDTLILLNELNENEKMIEWFMYFHEQDIYKVDYYKSLKNAFFRALQEDWEAHLDYVQI